MRVEKIVAAIGFFLFSLGFIFASVDFAIINPHFYIAEFSKNDSAMWANISDEDAERLWKQMVLYFSDNAESLQVQVTFNDSDIATDFYGADELSHMEDVKNVVVLVRVVSTVLMLLGLALGLLGICREKESGEQTATRLGRAAMQGCGAFLVFLVVLAALILPDFDAAFVVFHNIFFPQGNWAFDPSTPMIQLLPIELFMSAAAIILGSGIGLAIVCVCLGAATYLVFKRRAQ